jgi:type IV secretion system protein VirB8
MKPQSRETLDAYYADAASWNRDRVHSVRTSNRMAWMIAGGAAIIAVLEAVTLALLMPLKTVEPYTLMVDRTTGYVQALKPLDRTTITPDSALTQSFLVQYVIARESFDLATVNADYRKVMLLSADPARSSYLKQMQVSNPESPLVLYPRSTIIEARVKSVSPLGANAALVRFDTVRTDANGQSRSLGSWVAIVRYRYSNAAMSVEDRYVNPLGFQVTSYRRDPEALPAVSVDTVAQSVSQPTLADGQLLAVPPNSAARTTAPPMAAVR